MGANECGPSGQQHRQRSRDRPFYAAYIRHDRFWTQFWGRSLENSCHARQWSREQNEIRIATSSRNVSNFVEYTPGQRLLKRGLPSSGPHDVLG
jgi:hypothetical protein